MILHSEFVVFEFYLFNFWQFQGFKFVPKLFFGVVPEDDTMLLEYVCQCLFYFIHMPFESGDHFIATYPEFSRNLVTGS